MEILHIEEKQKKYFNSDDALYHYTKSSTALEYILKYMKLRFSSLNEFRDPKEKFLHHSSGAMWDDGSDLGQVIANLNQEIIKYQAKVRIACFSTNTQFIGNLKVNDFVEIFENNNIIIQEENPFKPQPGYDKDRMWEVYAENSTGICLVFSKDKLLKQIENNNYEFSNDYIHYSRNYFEAIKSNDGNEDPAIEAKKFWKSKLFKKPFDYRDENEFRILIYDDKKDDVYIDIKNSLKAVIFGIELNEIYYDLYFQLIDKVFGNDNDIIFLKAKLSTGIPYYYMLKARD